MVHDVFEEFEREVPTRVVTGDVFDEFTRTA